jgi:ABC-type transport system involved in multi-copper enzyme maturation permease subunit
MNYYGNHSLKETGTSVQKLKLLLVSSFIYFLPFIFVISVMTSNPSLICLGKTSWFSEYLRLWQHTPVLETEVLKGHTHQVLHVSFSHNGKYFASCSKDGYVMVKD